MKLTLCYFSTFCSESRLAQIRESSGTSSHYQTSNLVLLEYTFLAYGTYRLDVVFWL
ncbi:hypothetical protein F383_27348 [Gossypium arboreum]|uniref:Uncharacterized protein n=1 Tax=Gossypium arboreum TaxID=29729 RepID=A0A0B0PDQ0_GOSAR|nr:hypothetical protein F383_27348 [Gossypium arboreum]